MKKEWPFFWVSLTTSLCPAVLQRQLNARFTFIADNMLVTPSAIDAVWHTAGDAFIPPEVKDQKNTGNAFRKRYNYNSFPCMAKHHNPHATVKPGWVGVSVNFSKNYTQCLKKK